MKQPYPLIRNNAVRFVDRLLERFLPGMQGLDKPGPLPPPGPLSQITHDRTGVPRWVRRHCVHSPDGRFWAARKRKDAPKLHRIALRRGVVR